MFSTERIRAKSYAWICASLLAVLFLSGGSAVFAASFTWTGGSAATDHWTDPANWGGTAPEGKGADDLVFAGEAKATNTNDFPAGTAFHSITFNAGGFTIGGQSLSVAALNNTAGTNALNTPLNLAAEAAVAVAPQTQLTLGGIISGAAGVAKTGDGALLFAAGNTYTGATKINAGVLKFGAGASLEASAVILANAAGATLDLAGDSAGIGSLAGGGTAGGVVDNSAAGSPCTLTVGNDDTNTTFAGVIKNSAGPTAALGLTKIGAGTLTLTGANSYDGVTLISWQLGNRAGAINIQNATALGSTVGGTVIEYRQQLQIQGGITVGAEPLTISSNGDGPNGPSSFRSLSGANEWGGTVTPTEGPPNNVCFQTDAGSRMTFSAALSFTTDNQWVPRAIQIIGEGDTIIRGVIDTGNTAATGGVIKDGTGTLTLAGASTYSGDTTVSAGTLFVINTTGSGTGTGAVTVSAGATLGGTGTVSGDFTVNGSLAPGLATAPTAPVSLTVSGSVTFAASAALRAYVGDAGTSQVVLNGGDTKTLMLPGTANSLFVDIKPNGTLTHAPYTVLDYSAASHTLGAGSSLICPVARVAAGGPKATVALDSTTAWKLQVTAFEAAP